MDSGIFRSEYIYVLVPLDRIFDDFFREGIKDPIEEKLGIYVDRNKVLMDDKSIVDFITSRIESAEVIIADITGANSNVMSALSYANSIGQKIIIIAQQEDEIPVNFKNYPKIVYAQNIDILKYGLLEKLLILKNKNSTSDASKGKEIDFSEIKIKIDDITLHPTPKGITGPGIRKFCGDYKVFNIHWEFWNPLNKIFPPFTIDSLFTRKDSIVAPIITSNNETPTEVMKSGEIDDTLCFDNLGKKIPLSISVPALPPNCIYSFDVRYVINSDKSFKDLDFPERMEFTFKERIYSVPYVLLITQYT